MSRKWRNILIGVLAVAVLVVLVTLLNQGASDYSSKYANADLSTDVSGIGRSNTYEAYVASHASDPEVGPRAGWPPHKNEKESRDVIRTVFHNDTTWAICLKESGEPVGAMGYAPFSIVSVTKR